MGNVPINVIGKTSKKKVPNNDLPIFKKMNLSVRERYSDKFSNSVGVYFDEYKHILFKSEYSTCEEYTVIVRKDIVNAKVLTSISKHWSPNTNSEIPFTIKLKGINKSGHAYFLYLNMYGTYKDAISVKNYFCKEERNENL